MRDNRLFGTIAATVALTGALSGCTSSDQSGTTSTSRPARTSTSATRPATTVPPKSTTTTTTLPHWSETRLLAQLIMVGASYSDVGASSQDVASGVGGLVFFGEPAAGTAAELGTQMTALLSLSKVPPFMSTDQEGGGVARLANLVGQLPWPRQMAAQWTPTQMTVEIAHMAAQMKALGMDMDLAPVLDTSSATNPVDDEALRSFSETGTTAATYGVAFLQGLEEGGVIGVVKHFPGLGHASANTDLGPATDPPLSQLGNDLVPFRAAIAAGVEVVMMSNVTEPDWGPLPASVNPASYRYLRQMGFDGVIITDSLDAGAISASGLSGPEAVPRAIEAGADMAMITNPSEFGPALSALIEAVSSGALPRSRVEASVRRILALKAGKR